MTNTVDPFEESPDPGKMVSVMERMEKLRSYVVYKISQRQTPDLLLNAFINAVYQRSEMAAVMELLKHQSPNVEVFEKQLTEQLLIELDKNISNLEITEGLIITTTAVLKENHEGQTQEKEKTPGGTRTTAPGGTEGSGS
jgi:hypothetical protein